MTTKTPPTATPPPPRRKARTTSRPPSPAPRRGEGGAKDPSVVSDEVIVFTDLGAGQFPGEGRGPVKPAHGGEARPPTSTIVTGPRPSPGNRKVLTGQNLAERQVTLAVITGAHGIGGEVKLKLFTTDLTPYRSFNDGTLTLTSLRGPVARLAEVPDRTAAERLRGTELTVPRSALPPLGEGEYYHADLIGLPCQTDTGEALGHVAAVENFGAGDILEIERPDGKRFMVPVSAAEVGEKVIVDGASAE